MLRFIQKKLLPGYFKFVGLALVLIKIGFVAYITFISKEFFTYSGASMVFFENLTFIFFIVGLFFVLMARKKYEDEWTKKLRADAIGEAFISVVFIKLLNSVCNLLDGTLFIISSSTMLGWMLVIAVSDYYWYKLRGKNLIQ